MDLEQFTLQFLVILAFLYITMQFILPGTFKKESFQPQPQPRKVVPFHTRHLDSYAKAMKKSGCKIAPWGEELCHDEPTKETTLADLDKSIHHLKKLIEEQEVVTVNNGNVVVHASA
tara:strand:- start:51 stop:401 length:351 start_codon:yes stop_codon:yes gene_type:complete